MEIIHLDLAKEVLKIAQEAGKKIMEIYEDPELSGQIHLKDDNSPLTLADRRSHEYIMEHLSVISDLPIISEESAAISYETRKNWDKFWLVDPLDGTKEFINKNGEFTVNIALIENGLPTLGIIDVPAKKVSYLGAGGSAIMWEDDSERKLQIAQKDSNRIAVRSKSHPSPEEEVVLEKYDVKDFISVGSSLKFCMVAEGKADIYYRHGPTMEWDIAAGHAIVRAAGGEVYQGNTTKKIFSYNKENLLNGSFLCMGF